MTSIAIYIHLLLFISSNKFELNSFDKMIEKLNPKSFVDFVPIDEAKKNILVELEDKTYFDRTKSHNFISLWYFIRRQIRGYSTLEMQLYR